MPLIYASFGPCEPCGKSTPHTKNGGCAWCRRKGKRKVRKAKRGGQPEHFAAHRALELEADDLWRRIIWAKAPDGICPRCRRRRGLQAMHIVSRSHKQGALRWDESNGLPGCPGCHHELGMDHEAHRDYAIACIGRDEYDRLLLLKNGRGFRVDMRIVILHLRTYAAAHGVDVSTVKDSACA